MVRDEESRRLRIILVPFPAQGHVTPMLHLAQALHARGLAVTLACPDFIHRHLASRLDLLRSGHDAYRGIRFASIASGAFASDKHGSAAGAPKDFAAVVQAMEEHMPDHLERLLRSSDDRRTVVVVDLLASWAIPVARRCGAVVAGFWPAMLATYRIISAIPELIRREFISHCGIPVDHGQSDSHDEELINLFGEAKLSTKHLPWLVGNPDSQKQRFKFWLQTLERAKTLQWLLVNSFPGEGGEELAALHPPPSMENDGPSILQIGPLMASIPAHKLSMRDEDSTCLEWLDQHPPNSVVYVSFGSWVAPLSHDKLAELALALDAARHPFLWVSPAAGGWRAGISAGYLSRVAGRGKVVEWAPQEEVLKHESIRCYITHCGWNSTLEAIQHMKPLLCYPVSGDQFVNCEYIVKAWKIGITSDGTGRAALHKAIERIMEGEEGKMIEKRMEELKERVMGHMGTANVMANLQSFINEVQKSV